jgi:hypothetical protein
MTGVTAAGVVGIQIREQLCCVGPQRVEEAKAVAAVGRHHRVPDER